MNKLIKFWTVSVLIFSAGIVFAASGESLLLKEYEPLLLSSDLSKSDVTDQYTGYDFSTVWATAVKHDYLGFIGNDYQRIRVRLFSIIKDAKAPRRYYVYGKSAVNDDIQPFQGVFEISRIRLLEKMHWGCDDEYKDSGIVAQGILLGTYRLFQNSESKKAGFFEGQLSALWYIDKNGMLKYDDIESFADLFRNNQFMGSWKSYRGSLFLKCNWGDTRIPQDGDLDVGVGEFYPNKKYAKYGWQSFIDAETSRKHKRHEFNWNQ